MISAIIKGRGVSNFMYPQIVIFFPDLLTLVQAFDMLVS